MKKFIFIIFITLVAFQEVLACDYNQDEDNNKNFQIAFNWNGSEVCNNGSSKIIYNPIYYLKNIPNNTMSINFELEDVDLSFSHGGGSVSIDDISKNKNKKFKKFKYKINKKAFQYLSPCSFDKKHTYRWYAYAIDDWDNVLGEIAISEKKYP